jgi:hypothetical protein
MNCTAAKSGTRPPSVDPDRPARPPISSRDTPSERFGFAIMYETPTNFLRAMCPIFRRSARNNFLERSHSRHSTRSGEVHARANRITKEP